MLDPMAAEGITKGALQGLHSSRQGSILGGNDNEPRLWAMDIEGEVNGVCDDR
jgi:hypothetical protein